MPPKALIEELEAIVGKEDADAFVEYATGLDSGKLAKDALLDFKGDFSDKQKRTNTHKFFKAHLLRYESDTLQLDEKRMVRVFLHEGMSKNKRQKQGITSHSWGDRSLKGVKMPEILQFALQKTNFESMQAVHYIAKRVKKQSKFFAICGNKDKRGITTQRVTLSRGNAEQMIRAQRSKDWDGKIKMGSFQRVFKEAALGALTGNRFSIALRFIPPDIEDAEIGKNVTAAMNEGFVNYFGMQRFGTYSVRTHEIGKEVVRHNWKEVVRMILRQHAEIDDE